ncbi:MAG: hypothetical protein U5N56_07880 [Candidatus Marinimicrobia bacterium]|nr:hypothetical protein [Candidatus Neomarinimicrobiota bacterium]
MIVILQILTLAVSLANDFTEFLIKDFQIALNKGQKAFLKYVDDTIKYYYKELL